MAHFDCEYCAHCQINEDGEPICLRNLTPPEYGTCTSIKYSDIMTHHCGDCDSFCECCLGGKNAAKRTGVLSDVPFAVNFSGVDRFFLL